MTFVGQFLVALPVALLCAFVLKLEVLGLYIGLVAAVVVQSCSYLCLLYRVDWGSQAHKAALTARSEGVNSQGAGQTMPPL